MTNAKRPSQGARLLVFAKAPEAGLAKTRLIPLLGTERAARLQARLTRRAVATALAADSGEVELWCAPDAGHPYFAALGAEWDVSLHSQCGGDFGEKMLHAAARSAASDRAVLILGTDCPRLTKLHLQQALAILREGKEAVLIPAEDGGYVLLGLTRVAPELFRGVEWGTDRVLAQTRARLEGLGFHFGEMPPLSDLDLPEDCIKLRRENSRLWHELISEENVP